jgi:hypothetical protein
MMTLHPRAVSGAAERAASPEGSAAGAP